MYCSSGRSIFVGIILHAFWSGFSVIPRLLVVSGTDAEMCLSV